MLNFVPEELVWAITRERQEEARQTRPHTAVRPDPERTAHERHDSAADGIWAGRTLRAAAR